MANSIQQLQNIGQAVWYDNMRRGLITSGELQRLIDLGVSGLTSNPTISEKAIAGSNDYDQALLELAESDKSTDGIYEALVIEDIQSAADLLRPVFDRTSGADGFASLEVSPTSPTTPTAPSRRPGGSSPPSTGPMCWSRCRVPPRASQRSGS